LIPVATDNCDATVPAVKVAGAFVPNLTCTYTGTYTNTFTATDDCGNVSAVYTRLSLFMTMLLQFGPVLPAVLTVSYPAVISLAEQLLRLLYLLLLTIVMLTLFCENCRCFRTRRTLSRSWYLYQHIHSNWSLWKYQYNFTQIITIYDNTPPVWTSFPANVTVSCSDYIVDVNPPLIVPTATDNCDGNVFVGYAGEVTVPGTCPNEFYRVREWNAVDDCGNWINGYQQIHVVDIQLLSGQPLPVILTVPFPAVILQLLQLPRLSPL